MSPGDIAELLQTLDIAIQRSEISMPDGPIKTVGEHSVAIILHPELQSTIQVVVEAENVPEVKEGIDPPESNSDEEGAPAS